MTELGKLITNEYESRDAVHFAIIPVEAGELIYPAALVGVQKGIAYMHSAKKVGIADPFLKTQINKGDRFWLMMLPNTTTSIRHTWAHPAFDADVTSSQSTYNALAIDFMTEFVSKYEISIDDVLTKHPREWNARGDDANNEFKENWQFWQYYTQVTGNHVDLHDFHISCWC